MYKTSDTQLAAYLVTMGHILQEVDRTNPQRIVFIFEDIIKLRKDEDVFYNGNPVCNVIQYEANKKSLLKKIYQNG